MTFISFEGCDYVGKSTQIKLLFDYIAKLGKKVYMTREPGGSQLAETIRSVLLNTKEIKDPLIEYLLLAAGRKDHVDRVIKPKLKESYIVLSDRFFDSSLCYQGYIKGLNIEVIKQIKALTIQNFQPTFTILLTLSEQELLYRMNKKQREGHNTYDDKTAGFYLNVQAQFQKIATESGDRFISINANRSEEVLHQKIVSALKKRKI